MDKLHKTISKYIYCFENLKSLQLKLQIIPTLNNCFLEEFAPHLSKGFGSQIAYGFMSLLRCVHNYTRSIMAQSRLFNLAVLTTKSAVLLLNTHKSI